MELLIKLCVNRKGENHFKHNSCFIFISIIPPEPLTGLWLWAYLEMVNGQRLLKVIILNALSFFRDKAV